MAIDPYVTVAEMRAEGVTTAMADDARVTRAVALAQEYFEFQTLLFFNYRANTTFRIDGSGTTVLELPAPALSITSVTVDTMTVIEVTDPGNPPFGGSFVNYNDEEGDDWWFPRLEMFAGPLTRMDRAFYGYSSPWNPTGIVPIWPWGRKNVVVTGDFGFVDTDTHATPLLVKEAILRLAIQKLKPLTKVNPRNGMFQSETLGSYSYSLGANAQNYWGFSSDPVVNEIIANYSRLASMRSV